MNKLIFILCITFTLLVKAQEPSYRVIGKKEFSGYDIYSINQNSEGLIYLATNNGVYKHNGKEITKLKSPKLRDKSFFGFIEDTNKRLYCYNLIGEIYQVTADSILLYSTINEQYLSEYFSFQFTDQEGVILSLKQPLLKIKSGAYSRVFNENQLFFNSIIKTKQNKIVMYCYSEQRIYFIDAKTLKKTFIDIKDGPKSNGRISFDLDNEDLYMFDHLTYIVYKIEENTYSKIQLEKSDKNYRSEIFRAYLGGRFCLSLSKGGFLLFSKTGEKRFNTINFSHNVFSGFLQDNEGNFWATTLDNGVFYFTQTPFISYVDHPKLKNEFINKVAFCPDAKLYLGTMSGKILIEKNNELNLFYDNHPAKINYLEYIDNVIYSTDGIFPLSKTAEKLIFEPKKKLIHKDFEQINDQYFYATSSGLYMTDPSFENDSILLQARIHRLAYVPEYNKLWIASNRGLYYYKNGRVIKYNLKGNYSIPIDLQIFDEKLWVATESDGILLLKDDTIIKELSLGKGLESNEINKIRFQNHKLYISHSKGLQVNTIEGYDYDLINTSSGLFSNNIRDFDVLNDKLAVVTYLGLQKIDLKALKKSTFKPRVTIVKVSGANGEIYTNNTVLDYNKPSIKFEFETFIYQHDILYEYKLVKDNQLSIPWSRDVNQINKIHYPSLSSGEYTFYLKAVTDHNLESDIISYSFTIEYPFWKTYWFWTIIMICFSIIIYYIFSYNIKKIKQENEIKSELSHLKLTALKSQMNPHFIFNALNSIQALVLKQDVKNAYDYIVKFSTLVRQTLSYSGQDFIEIQDEINLLKLYLTLEQLRFSDDLTFNINIPENINGSIPPMLIQPFVENAIKHGLLHKEGRKTISVEFSIDELLICKIIDNGIGVVRSEEIKKRQGRKYESFSVNSLTKRFKILSEMYGDEVGFTINELKQETIVKGTEVIIKIPINYHV